MLLVNQPKRYMRMKIIVGGKLLNSKDPPKPKVLIRDEKVQILLPRVMQTRSNKKRKWEVDFEMSNRQSEEDKMEITKRNKGKSKNEEIG